MPCRSVSLPTGPDSGLQWSLPASYTNGAERLYIEEQRKHLCVMRLWFAWDLSLPNRYRARRSSGIIEKTRVFLGSPSEPKSAFRNSPSRRKPTRSATLTLRRFRKPQRISALTSTASYQDWREHQGKSMPNRCRPCCKSSLTLRRQLPDRTAPRLIAQVHRPSPYLSDKL